MAQDELELCTLLAHELSVALEMSYDAVELRELWGDAIDALRRTRVLLVNKGLVPPAALDNVLRLASSGTSPP